LYGDDSRARPSTHPLVSIDRDTAPLRPFASSSCLAAPALVDGRKTHPVG
uniref:Transcriptional regulator n=1 Tax=Haemonchus placei TaxID=6290 RepID=A0A0N4X9C0_HAEPC